MTTAFYDSEHLEIEWSHHVCAMQVQGYFQLNYNLVRSKKHIQRLDVEKKRKMYSVDSLTAL